ncbi:pilin [Comamonas aquatica]|uniref:Pilin n=2 Tax=Comamonas aquatica TaxID=225991 RepID=A0AA42L6C0_9BURK|nr:pilin [Comamonas aquatica]
MSEVIMQGSSCRTSMTETFQTSASDATIAANNWGCEKNITNASAANAPSKFVYSISTAASSDGGTITIISRGIKNRASDAEDGQIRMKACSNNASTFATCNNVAMGSNPVTWICGPGETNPVETRFLPSSCRAS